MNLSEATIKEIAEELDAGMIVYINTETLETKSIIDFESHIYADPEQWEEKSAEIEENFEKYFEFERMDSRDSFRVMEEFTETVQDEKLRDKLELCLQLSKPFRNFKDVIDCEVDYRTLWFKFKEQKYIEFVKEQLERYNNRLDDDI